MATSAWGQQRMFFITFVMLIAFIIFGFLYTKSPRHSIITNPKVFTRQQKCPQDGVRPVDKAFPTVEKFIRTEIINDSFFDETRSQPVIVTAFDKSHYTEGEGLIRNLNQQFGRDNYHLVVYDLGLSKNQKKWMKNYCNLSKCDYKEFDYSKYPEHVKNLHTYAFKPIVIGETLQTYGFVFWVDTSFRLIENKTDELISIFNRTASDSGIIVWPTLKLYCFVHKGMYEYFKADVEYFKSNDLLGVRAGTIVVHNAKWVRELVIYPWLTCALIKECIAPAGSHLKPCNFSAPENYCCHRYEQAALAIILYQLFNFRLKDIMLEGLEFKFHRGDRSGRNYIRNFRVNN